MSSCSVSPIIFFGSFAADILWTTGFLPIHIEEIAKARTFDMQAASEQELFAFLLQMVGVNSIAWAWYVHSSIFSKFSELLFKYVFRIFGPRGSPIAFLAGYPNNRQKQTMRSGHLRVKRSGLLSCWPLLGR